MNIRSCRLSPSRTNGRMLRLPVSSDLYVPSDSFGGMSPEKKAGVALKKLFTFCAAKAVMAQLEGSGRGNLGSYNATGYGALRDCIGSLSSMDCSDWLRALAEDQMIAVRVMEVRAFYCDNEFEWENCRKVASSLIEQDNLDLMRDVLEKSANFD